MIKVGLIGAGKWGKNYIHTLSALDNVKLVWLRTSKSEGVIDYDSVDCIIIATPSDTHYVIAKDALEHNKHVLCEKPLTKNLEEAKELIRLSHQKNVILMVGHEYLYHSGIMLLKEMIDNDDLGKIYEISFTRKRYNENMDDVVWEMGVHDIYTAMFLLDKENFIIEQNHGNNRYRDILLSNKNIDIYIRSDYYKLNCRVTEFQISAAKGRIEFLEDSIKIYESQKPIREIPHIGFALENECKYFFDCVLKNKIPTYNQESAINTIKLLEQLQK